ncbi:MAG: HNH endonuclease [Sphingobacterium sp.]|nr:HNH endonuclease [Sphingobacterium sp.]
MRKVNKNFLIRPRSLVSVRAPYRKALGILNRNRCWSNQSTALYSSPSILESLNKIYDGKCAYCELIPQGSPLQVEHFRPKDKLAEDARHTGYYWVAYEWSNLLLACSNCNSRKGNHFPIRSEPNRVITPTFKNGEICENHNYILNEPLKSERGMLLNPEIDEPQQHLAYSPAGKLLDLTDRGDISIELYDLNRDELYLNGRKKIIDNIYSKLFRVLNRYLQNNRNAEMVIVDIEDIIKDMIILPIVEKSSFTAFFKSLLLRFDLYIINRFPQHNIKFLLRKAYRNVISE